MSIVGMNQILLLLRSAVVVSPVGNMTKALIGAVGWC